MGGACVWSWCLGLVFWRVGLVGGEGKEGKGGCLREKGRFAAGGVAEEEDGYCWCGVHGHLIIDAFESPLLRGADYVKQFSANQKLILTLPPLSLRMHLQEKSGTYVE